MSGVRVGIVNIVRFILFSRGGTNKSCSAVQIIFDVSLRKKLFER